MANYFSIDVLAPSRVVGRNLPADFISVSTCKGEIQILPEHTDLVTELSTGILQLKGESLSSKSFLITKGICKIVGRKVTILSKLCEMSQEIDVTKTKESLIKIQDQIKANPLLGLEEMTDLLEKFKRAQLRLKLVETEK